MLFWEALYLVAILCCLDALESTRWPAGTYGIPKPSSGCPKPEGFAWMEGWRSQDSNNKTSNNSKSVEFHLDGSVDKKIVNRSFCIKSSKDDKNRPLWPEGRYCIYKSGECPKGLKQGYVRWNDNDSDSDAKGGTLPGGKFKDKLTEIRFCCKTDGDKDNAIVLPAKTPFFLLAYESAKCQMVKWAIATLEWIFYDTEHGQNVNKTGGSFPYDAGIKQPTIYYCYYRGCNETLTEASATFHSPNYPGKYPDGQYCSWWITVSSAQQIHLMFTNFSLQHENNTDVLYVYDGKNSTGNMLGMYYGDHPPPKEGIFSSSNQMFLIFKSDKNESYTGFNAFYCENNCSKVTTGTMRTPTATSSEPHKTTSVREPTPTSNVPSGDSRRKDQRKQSKGKVHLVAVIVPVVVLVLLVASLVAGLLYYKRRRTKRENLGQANEVVYARPYEETPMSLENMGYERNPGEAPMSVTNPCYDRGLCSGFTIANRGSATEENELYTEVKEPENLDKKEAFKQQSPVYATLEPNETVFNPIYADSSM